MVKIPVSLENLDFERLDLHRHFVVIDCDFTVYLILNPVGEKPLSGTDVAVINIGSWQIDAWKFLVRDNFPNEAGFSAVLAWDKTLVQDTEQGRKRPRITESDVDIADSVSSLKGQPVNITGFSLDDGKSLKVSTLENEFCFIRPFPSDSLLTTDIVNVGNVFVSYKVGDSIDVESFINYFKKKYLVSYDDVNNKISLKVSNLSVESASPDTVGYFCFVVNNLIGRGVKYSNSNYCLGLSDFACVCAADVDINVSDGVITSLHVKVKYLATTPLSSGDTSFRPITYVQGIDSDVASLSLW